jgi:hypothetical protein
METCSSETSNYFQRTTRRYIPEDTSLQSISYSHHRGSPIIDFARPFFYVLQYTVTAIQIRKIVAALGAALLGHFYK